MSCVFSIRGADYDSRIYILFGMGRVQEAGPAMPQYVPPKNSKFIRRDRLIEVRNSFALAAEFPSLRLRLIGWAKVLSIFCVIGKHHFLEPMHFLKVDFAASR